jgi:hypothetical protein
MDGEEVAAVLTRFYEQVDPEKASPKKVRKLMAQFEAKAPSGSDWQELLFGKLTEKYSKDPREATAAHEAEPEPEPDATGPAEAETPQSQRPPPSSPKTPRSSLLGDDEDKMRVVLRVRPLNKRELAAQKKAGGSETSPPPLAFAARPGTAADRGPNRVQLTANKAGAKKKKPYDFDEVFPEDTQQHELFERVGQSTVEDVMEGFNGTIFAYGQTGSGKTHTMQGSSENQGIIPRAVNLLFGLMEPQYEFSFEVQVSYLQVYKEQVDDLLAPANKNLQVVGMTGEVKGLTNVYVESTREILELINQGDGRRVVASHKMNEESSRSHSVLTIRISKTHKHTGTVLQGDLNLVDLAGSENIKDTGASGERLKELVKINTSLMTLNTVLRALSSGKTVLGGQYRESKLTTILKESLGGNCRTTLLLAASPSVESLSETIRTLDVGMQAKTITLSAKLNDKKSAEELTQQNTLLLKENGNMSARIKMLQATLEAAGIESPDVVTSKSVPTSLKDKALDMIGLQQTVRIADLKLLKTKLAAAEVEVDSARLDAQEAHNQCAIAQSELNPLQERLDELEHRMRTAAEEHSKSTASMEVEHETVLRQLREQHDGATRELREQQLKSAAADKSESGQRVAELVRELNGVKEELNHVKEAAVREQGVAAKVAKEAQWAHDVLAQQIESMKQRYILTSTHETQLAQQRADLEAQHADIVRQLKGRVVNPITQMRERLLEAVESEMNLSRMTKLINAATKIAAGHEEEELADEIAQLQERRSQLESVLPLRRTLSDSMVSSGPAELIELLESTEDYAVELEADRARVQQRLQLLVTDAVAAITAAIEQDSGWVAATDVLAKYEVDYSASPDAASALLLLKEYRDGLLSAADSAARAACEQARVHCAEATTALEASAWSMTNASVVLGLESVAAVHAALSAVGLEPVDALPEVLALTTELEAKHTAAAAGKQAMVDQANGELLTAQDKLELGKGQIRRQPAAGLASFEQALALVDSACKLLMDAGDADDANADAGADIDDPPAVVDAIALTAELRAGLLVALTLQPASGGGSVEGAAAEEKEKNMFDYVPPSGYPQATESEISEAKQHAFLDLAKGSDWKGLLKAVGVTPNIVNATPRGRWSALHQAASVRDKGGAQEAVKLLLEAGADPLIRNRDDQTPRDVATRAEVQQMLEEAEQPEVHPSVLPMLAPLLLQQQQQQDPGQEQPPLLHELQARLGWSHDQILALRSTVERLQEQERPQQLQQLPEAISTMDLLAARAYLCCNVLFRGFTEAVRSMPRPHAPPDEYKAMYTHLSAVIHHAPLEACNAEGQGLFCSAPIGSSNLWNDGSADGKTYKEGLVVTWQDFRIMSTNRETAIAVVKEYSAGEQVLFEILGTPAGLGAKLSGAALGLCPPFLVDEEQVVLPAGASFKVVERNTGGGCGAVLEVKLVYVGALACAPIAMPDTDLPAAAQPPAAAAAEPEPAAEPPTVGETEQHAFLDLAKLHKWDAVKQAVAEKPNGVLINVQPSGRWSALHQAASCGSTEAVAMLLEQGADVWLKNRDGKTARELAPPPARNPDSARLHKLLQQAEEEGGA